MLKDKGVMTSLWLSVSPAIYLWKECFLFSPIWCRNT